MKLSTPYPNTFQIGKTIYPSGEGYSIVDEGDGHVTILHEDKVIVPRTHFNEWTDEQDLPFATVDDLIKEFCLDSRQSTNSIFLEVDTFYSAFVLNAIAKPSDPKNMNVLGSLIAPITYETIIPNDLLLKKFKLYIEDNTAFSNGSFGALPALLNGVVLRIAGVPAGLFKTNQDIVMAADEATSHPFLENVNRHMLAKRMFDQRFFIQAGQKIELVIQDDLTGLVNFNFRINGTKV